MIKSPLPKSAYTKNALIYKILSSAERLEILNLLKEGETSVENLLDTMKLPKANLSQHLALLRHSGIVTARREGLNVFYTIIDPRIVEPCRILHQLRDKKFVI